MRKLRAFLVRLCGTFVRVHLAQISTRNSKLTVVALALGWPAAWFLAKLASSFLYGIATHDAVTFATVPVVLACVALIACWIPARRAASINPTDALRMD